MSAKSATTKTTRTRTPKPLIVSAAEEAAAAVVEAPPEKKGPAVWMSWGDGEVKVVEYKGYTFSACRHGSVLYAGDFDARLHDGYYGYRFYKNGAAVSDKIVQSFYHTAQETTGSCAYKRVHIPLNATDAAGNPSDKQIAIAEWYLSQVDLSKPTLCWVTPKDGRWKVIGNILIQRGFNHICTAKSIHADYGVRLYVYPGEYDKNKEFPNEDEKFNPRKTS